ncbi:hypothetical protein SAMN02982922_0680 [Mesorhizobium australicum]|uniref:Uncharacterized protein n=1 Tax=Mesorhizobium australicum TaxID=536018 RepID=A0A1X7MT96_9HYPH|nr:hypothetical protein SAMN02982922_0680 [Mesorhizobium australicum]
MMTVNEIFAEDRRNPPAERSLRWEETRGGITIVVEPKQRGALGSMPVNTAAMPTGTRTAAGRGSTAISIPAVTICCRGPAP